METWKCPKCGTTVEARGATSVQHRCPRAPAGAAPVLFISVDVDQESKQ